MADDVRVTNMGKSAEEVAYALLDDVRHAENKVGEDADRAYILDTYAECLEAVKDNRAWRK